MQLQNIDQYRFLGKLSMKPYRHKIMPTIRIATSVASQICPKLSQKLPLNYIKFHEAYLRVKFSIARKFSLSPLRQSVYSTYPIGYITSSYNHHVAIVILLITVLRVENYFKLKVILTIHRLLSVIQSIEWEQW